MRLWAAAGTFVLGLVTALVLVRVLAPQGLDGVTDPPRPVSVRAESENRAEERNGIAALRWGEAESLFSPQWSGLVTSVSARPGDSVTTGTPVAAIDGITRTAAATSGPFWRSLRRGDTGADVSMLQELIGRLGYGNVPASGTFDVATERLVRAWASDIGAGSDEGTFDAAWVIWLPKPTLEVATLEVIVGSPAPAPGAPVAIGRVPLLEAVLLTNEDAPLEIPELGDWHASVAGIAVALAADQPTRIAAQDLSRLEALIDPETTSVPVVLKAPQRSVVIVPATAVMTNTSGDLCVWVDASGAFAAEAVTLAGGSFNTAEIAAGLEPGVMVLANPGRVLPDPTCP